MSLVLAESCLLTTLGGVLGLGLAYLIVPVLAKALAGLLPMFFLPTRDLLIGLGLSIALGLVTGIFPALQAMRLRVADALRRM
jgi:putative ABC transport system permease protein